jgi:hypothetical protein
MLPPANCSGLGNCHTCDFFSRQRKSEIAAFLFGSAIALHRAATIRKLPLRISFADFPYRERLLFLLGRSRFAIQHLNANISAILRRHLVLKNRQLARK